MNSQIVITDLVKKFGSKKAAVDGVSVSVPDGSFLVLLGPSGCGKTTMLRMLAGLETPSSGTIQFGDRMVVDAKGTALAPGSRGAGLVFQSYALWPHMTVKANVEWPLKVAKMPAKERRARVTEVLELLSIAELAERFPGEISGGQQQRVAIARMIAPSPSVLLFDEPLSNLDAKLRVETRGELVRVHRATGATSVYVTHDQVEAMTMATHVALLRDGKIEQFGPPQELIDFPASAFVATFIGTPPANVLHAEAQQGTIMLGDTAIGQAPSHISDGKVDVMYRAEALGFATEPQPRSIQVEFAEAVPLAGRYVVMTHAGAERVSVVVDERPPLAPGEAAWVVFPDAPQVCFDSTTGFRIDAPAQVEAAA